jgi:hypothetical protein
MTDQPEQRKGRLRRWLDRRREAQRRASQIAKRRKAARGADFDRAERHSGVGGP